MLFILDELEIYEELRKRPYLANANSTDIIQRIAQERRKKTTAVAELKTFISSPQARSFNSMAK